MGKGVDPTSFFLPLPTLGKEPIVPLPDDAENVMIALSPFLPSWRESRDEKWRGTWILPLFSPCSKRYGYLPLRSAWPN